MSKCGAICEVFSRVCGYFLQGKKGFRGEEICTKKSGRQIVRWCVMSAAE